MRRKIKQRISFFVSGAAYTITHVDSQQNLAVNLADFIAGAFLLKYNKQNRYFSDTIQRNVAFEKIVNWIESKRKSIQTKIPQTGASTHRGNL